MPALESGIDKPAKRVYYDIYKSPIGTLYIIFSGKALTGISFTKPKIKMGRSPDTFKSQLKNYFEGRLNVFDQETEFSDGTDFEKKVWLTLKDVPYGETRSYKWLAERVGTPKGSRAVGQALSKNPIPIVLPCHRIIESGGDLGGYSSGEDIKRRLLALEFYHSRTRDAEQGG